MGKVSPPMRHLLDWLLDQLYPRNCEATGKPVEPASPLKHFCAEAAARGIWVIQPPCCPHCGAPFWGAADSLRPCNSCDQPGRRYQHGASLLLLRDAGRTLVHELKYRRGLHLLHDIHQLLTASERFQNFLAGATLVPVPLHPLRQWWRGFNQAQLIAETFAQHPDTTVAPILKRKRYTRTQTRLNRSQRQRNTRGAFEVRKGVAVSRHTRYIIVDDVFTTGATLNACAKALRRHGARDIDIATLTHACDMT